MRILLLSFLLLSLTPCSAQNIEINSGAVRNLFFNYRQEGHFTSSYENEWGYGFHLALDKIYLDSLPLRLSVGLVNYGGSFEASNGGLGAGYKTEASIEKTILIFGIFPLNLNVKDKLQLNFGFQYSHLLNEKFSGTKSSWMMYQGSTNEKLEDVYDKFSASGYLGFNFRLAYQIKLGKSWFLVPQCSLYWGLSPEFIHFPKVTRSCRSELSIGFKKAFCKK